MTEAVRGLLRSMDELVHFHLDLIDITEEQRQALITSDTAGLEQLVAKLEKTSAEVLDVEQQRIVWTEQIVKECGVANSDVTAEMVADVLDEAARERFTKLASTLRGLVVELAEANERNRLLTEQSVDYMNHILSMVSGAANKPDNYGRPSQKTAPASQGARMFDVQA